ncbi:cyclic-phosphate processing receiver domain-containing protein [uncultured Salinicola sp.]|uniref:cyclic-phosphate processing receiver domain-containing protein n=1 Tax=uncultured Salinicola sp. TaxID=1193542 RepID=UPI00263944EC|nr:cyclic-phosphate processing receiver domain-containing protein [uncultured Salinicola sp.]|tara:strand:- start:3843 stop:4367 length:525 start_codon:yes stop_codon:yes gene_type:complete
MRIFIDDERMPLASEAGEWVIVRDPTTAFGVIRANAHLITHLSFDNDLGFETEGRDIMAELFGTPVVAPTALPRLVEIRVHSANIVANQAMLDLARSAQKATILMPDVTIVNRSALHEDYRTIVTHDDPEMRQEEQRLETLRTTNNGEDEIERLKDVERRHGIIMEGNGICLLR